MWYRPQSANHPNPNRVKVGECILDRRSGHKSQIPPTLPNPHSRGALVETTYLYASFNSKPATFSYGLRLQLQPRLAIEIFNINFQFKYHQCWRLEHKILYMQSTKESNSTFSSNRTRLRFETTVFSNIFRRQVNTRSILQSFNSNPATLAIEPSRCPPNPARAGAAGAGALVA